MTMLEKLALPEVRELIADGDLVTLREVLNRWLPADIADLLGDLSSKEDIIAFQCLAPVLAANDTEATAVDCFRRYDRTVLPVTDARNLLLGVVTVVTGLVIYFSVALVVLHGTLL